MPSATGTTCALFRPLRLAVIRLCALVAAACITPAGAPPANATPAGTECPLLRAAAESARAEQGATLLRSLADQARADPTCRGAPRQRLDALTAEAIEQAVMAALAAGEALEVYESTLRQSVSYAARWRVLAWLGDLARDRNRFDDAVRDYRQALTQILDPVATPVPPEETVITRLHRRAEQSRLLAQSYVPLPSLAQVLARVTPPVAAPSSQRTSQQAMSATAPAATPPPRTTVEPIAFQFNTVAFTAKGQAAVDDLLARLKAEHAPPITLIGHTDAQGGADYNLALSRRRAEAVRAYMLKAGYSGTIRTEGRGAGEPLALEDTGRYSASQIHQLNRRVEVRIETPVPATVKTNR